MPKFKRSEDEFDTENDRKRMQNRKKTRSTDRILEEIEYGFQKFIERKIDSCARNKLPYLKLNNLAEHYFPNFKGYPLSSAEYEKNKFKENTIRCL